MTSSNCSCSHRSHRSHCSRGNLCSPDSLDSLDNLDSRAEPIFRPAGECLRSLCQRHRSSPRSRPRSPPRRARLGEFDARFGDASKTCPPVAADAPLASANDAPTTPNTGTTSVWCLRFEDCLVRGMLILPRRFTIVGSQLPAQSCSFRIAVSRAIGNNNQHGSASVHCDCMLRCNIILEQNSRMKPREK